jgi:hypothetical protein
MKSQEKPYEGARKKQPVPNHSTQQPQHASGMLVSGKTLVRGSHV